MPIAFRCELCRKKLQVARRKVGTSVECPSCLRTITVPSVGSMSEQLDEVLQAASARKPDTTSTDQVNLNEMPLFERHDFENLLTPDDRADAAKPQTDDTAESPVLPASTETLTIQRSTLSIAVVCVVSLLGLAFAVGYLVGAK